MSALPPYVTRDLVAERLPLVFPQGTPNQNYCVRAVAASTVFTALYIGAMENAGRYLGPAHVYRMTDMQAARRADADREAYARDLLKRNVLIPGTRWYADNSRESIRDETLRDGLVAVGAVFCREDLPTTSSSPRYALRAAFASLFDPALQDEELAKAIAIFQNKHLSKSALTRVTLMRAGVIANKSGVRVVFPNGDTRQLAPGPSSSIAQAVIEIFAKRFLVSPAVVWLSESGKKVVVRDDQLAQSIGLNIEADKHLPDLILVDMRNEGEDPLLIFAELVATDGAITAQRQRAIHALTDAAGFDRKQIAFLTAYQDRESPGFKKTIGQLAWGSLAWFASEPQHILVMRGGEEDGHTSLGELIGR